MVPRLIFTSVALVVISTACSNDTAVTTTVVPTTTTTVVGTTVADTTTTSTSAPRPDPADVVYLGGDVVTMDPENSIAEALALRSDVIVAVGAEEDISEYIGETTIVIDLDGRAIAPGFVDPHSHILTDYGDFAAGQAAALSNGITSLGDGSVEPDAYDLLVSVAESGELRIRTSMYLARTDPCGVDMGDWYTAHSAGSEPANRLRVAGVKVFADGGVCGAVALSETFVDGYEPGEPYHSVDTLIDWIGAADAAGYQMVIHAQGDLAIRGAQDAYAAVLDGGGNPLRHRIDHNSIPTPDLLPRFTELDLVPVVFSLGGACQPDAPWTDFYKQNGDRPGDMVRANPDIRVAWHGDDPWVPPEAPILDLYQLVTRDEFADDGSICPAPEWAKDGGVSVQQAYEMVTINGAYALDQDADVGSLVVGKKADLIVLSANPLAVPVSEIPGVSVLSTMIGGGTEYCADGAELWCAGW